MGEIPDLLRERWTPGPAAPEWLKLLVSWAEPYQGQPRRKRCPRKSQVWMGGLLIATTLTAIAIGYNLTLVRLLVEYPH